LEIEDRGTRPKKSEKRCYRLYCRSVCDDSVLETMLIYDNSTYKFTFIFTITD